MLVQIHITIQSTIINTHFLYHMLTLMSIAIIGLITVYSHTCMNCHIYYDYNYIITISYI